MKHYPDWEINIRFFQVTLVILLEYLNLIIRIKEKEKPHFSVRGSHTKSHKQISLALPLVKTSLAKQSKALEKLTHKKKQCKDEGIHSLNLKVHFAITSSTWFCTVINFNNHPFTNSPSKNVSPGKELEIPFLNAWKNKVNQLLLHQNLVIIPAHGERTAWQSCKFS